MLQVTKSHVQSHMCSSRKSNNYMPFLARLIYSRFFVVTVAKPAGYRSVYNPEDNYHSEFIFLHFFRTILFTE